VLARRCKAHLGITPDELYVCGLLHDLGKLVMLECLKDDYLEVLRYARTRGLPMYAAENERLGFAHTDLGFVIAQQWGLAPQLCSAIQHHHGPREALQASPVATLVANVNLLVERVMGGNLSAAATVIRRSHGALPGPRARGRDRAGRVRRRSSRDRRNLSGNRAWRRTKSAGAGRPPPLPGIAFD
jgi:HD-like signal output (HDOD) protein